VRLLGSPICMCISISHNTWLLILASHSFNALLDASKTGLRLKEEVFQADQKKYGRTPPPDGILKRLIDEGEVLKRTFYDMLQAAVGKSKKVKDALNTLDPHLSSPWGDVLQTVRSLSQNKDTAPVAAILQREVDLINMHVNEAMVKFARASQKSMDGKQDIPPGCPGMPQTPKKRAKAALGTKSDQADAMRLVAEFFWKPIEGIQIYKSNLDMLRASCAYYRAQRPDKAFPWAVAFRELCLMKARASQKGVAPVTRQVDDFKGLTSSSVKVLAKRMESSTIF